MPLAFFEAGQLLGWWRGGGQLGLTAEHQGNRLLQAVERTGGLGEGEPLGVGGVARGEVGGAPLLGLVSRGGNTLLERRLGGGQRLGLAPRGDAAGEQLLEVGACGHRGPRGLLGAGVLRCHLGAGGRLPLGERGDLGAMTLELALGRGEPLPRDGGDAAGALGSGARRRGGLLRRLGGARAAVDLALQLGGPDGQPFGLGAALGHADRERGDLAVETGGLGGERLELALEAGPLAVQRLARRGAGGQLLPGVAGRGIGLGEPRGQLGNLAARGVEGRRQLPLEARRIVLPPGGGALAAAQLEDARGRAPGAGQLDALAAPASAVGEDDDQVGIGLGECARVVVTGRDRGARQGSGEPADVVGSGAGALEQRRGPGRQTAAGHDHGEPPLDAGQPGDQLGERRLVGDDRECEQLAVRLVQAPGGLVVGLEEVTDGAEHLLLGQRAGERLRQRPGAGQGALQPFALVAGLPARVTRAVTLGLQLGGAGDERVVAAAHLGARGVDLGEAAVDRGDLGRGLLLVAGGLGEVGGQPLGLGAEALALVAGLLGLDLRVVDAVARLGGGRDSGEQGAARLLGERCGSAASLLGARGGAGLVVSARLVGGVGRTGGVDGRGELAVALAQRERRGREPLHLDRGRLAARARLVELAAGRDLLGFPALRSGVGTGLVAASDGEPLLRGVELATEHLEGGVGLGHERGAPRPREP